MFPSFPSVIITDESSDGVLTDSLTDSRKEPIQGECTLYCASTLFHAAQWQSLCYLLMLSHMLTDAVDA